MDTEYYSGDYDMPSIRPQKKDGACGLSGDLSFQDVNDVIDGHEKLVEDLEQTWVLAGIKLTKEQNEYKNRQALEKIKRERDRMAREVESKEESKKLDQALSRIMQDDRYVGILRERLLAESDNSPLETETEEYIRKIHDEFDKLTSSAPSTTPTL
jgi:hypothetical protein